MRARFPEADRLSVSHGRGLRFRRACRGELVFAVLLGAMPAAGLRAAPRRIPARRRSIRSPTTNAPSALKTALANVVIEQTGDAGVLSRSDVAAAVGKAERYVLQFRYKQNAGARTRVRG